MNDNLVPKSLVDEAEGEICKVRIFVFLDWLLHLTPVQSPLWRGFPEQTFFKPGAIIGDRDRKRAPFQVLGLAPWYGTIFLFLEQIAPSPAAHAAKIFADVAQGKWRPRFLKSFMLLAHNSTRLCLLEFGFSIFVVSCSSLSEVRQCRI